MIHGYKRAFTLIEMMLAMTFVSMLLLSITMTAIQAGQIYNRGATLKTINQAGRDVGDAVRRDFLQTDPRLVSSGDMNNPNSTNAVITIAEGDASSGRFCLGQYSYLWNSAQTIDSIEELSSNEAIVYAADGVTPVNFVRVVDENGALCQKGDDGHYPNTLDDMGKVTSLLKTKAGSEDVVLSLYDMRVTRIATDNEHEALYRVQYTLGTSKTSEIEDQACRAPRDEDSNIEFCAINQFDMIVRTNG